MTSHRETKLPKSELPESSDIALDAYKRALEVTPVIISGNSGCHSIHLVAGADDVPGQLDFILWCGAENGLRGCVLTHFFGVG